MTADDVTPLRTSLRFARVVHLGTPVCRVPSRAGLPDGRCPRGIRSGRVSSHEDFKRALAVLLLGATISVTPTAQAQVVRQAPALRWAACGDGMECAKLTVPIDWKQPDGPKTQVDLARLPARDPARKLGSLVVNTGGGATIQLVRSSPVVSELTTWFDVVLIDPRGQGDRGSASAVACPTARPPLDRLILHPGEQGWQAHARDNAAHDASCRGPRAPPTRG